MKKSRYFAELGANYSAEIDDLVSDSEGKSVLKQRLDVKRREIQSISCLLQQQRAAVPAAEQRCRQPTTMPPFR